MRGGASHHHHDLFILAAPGKSGFHHAAFELGSIHELFGGGLNMTRCGWETALGPGRHPVSSCYFWYFKCPSGGAAERSLLIPGDTILTVSGAPIATVPAFRERIGAVVKPAALEELQAQALALTTQRRASFMELVTQHVYNVGRSAEAGASELRSIVQQCRS